MSAHVSLLLAQVLLESRGAMDAMWHPAMQGEQQCCQPHWHSLRTAQEEVAPTWEAIVIDVTKGSHALPKVCVIGTIAIQDELLLQHALASRKENSVREMMQALDEVSPPCKICPCAAGSTWRRAAV